MSVDPRAKGARFELSVANDLHGLLGIRFVRNLEQVRAENQGDLNPDDPAFPMLIECKHYAKGTGCKPAWIAQAVRAADKAGKIPCVVYKFDRRPARVHVPVQAIAEATGAAWIDCDHWADITLEGLAYVARELMARSALPEAAE